MISFGFRSSDFASESPRFDAAALHRTSALLDTSRVLKKTARPVAMAEPKENPLMEKIVSLCKRRGFIYQSSEIYGGINGFWDYGPLGAELKRNLRDAWWNAMMRQREDVLPLDASIIMHRAVWKASGHEDTFADIMRECPLTKKRVRSDQVEPESGTVYRWSGGSSRTSGWRSEKPFAVLLRKGENPESARKKAREFYAQDSLDWKTGEWMQLELIGETTTPVADSVDFHPESRVELGAARPLT
jgi:glycyl-tRNA synthetase